MEKPYPVVGDKVVKDDDDWKGLVDMHDIDRPYGHISDDFEDKSHKKKINDLADNTPWANDEGNENEPEPIVHLNLLERHADVMGDDRKGGLAKRQWRQVVDI